MDSTATATSSTTNDPTGPASHGRGRGLILFGAISVALISTAAAYVAMVGYGRDVLEMGAINAYAFAGVFELSLVTVALMAREAAKQNRPAQTLLTLTWLLSAASGFFAGWHEIHLGHAATAAAFRFIVPLLAALMWHLALVGDRHLAMERSWSELREGGRLHRMFFARVAWRREQATGNGGWISKRKIKRANARRIRAEEIAMRTVHPSKIDAALTEWNRAFTSVANSRTVADAFAAADSLALEDGTITVDGIVVSSDTKSLETGSSGVSETVSTDVSSGVSEPLESLSETVSNPVHVDGGDTVGGISKAVSTSLETVSGDTVDGVSGSLETPGETVSKSVSSSLEGVSNAVSQGVSEGRETVPSSVTDGVSGAVSAGVSNPLEAPRETVSRPVPKSTERPAKKSSGKKSRGKIDASMDAEIFARDAAGQKPPEIADALGIGRSTVYKRLQANTEAHTPAYGIPAVQVDERQ